MNTVEQAIFASLDTDGQPRYHVLAQSAGVCSADARELAVWEPSRDSLFDDAPDAESLNFHPLPSGAYCISRSLPSGRHRDGSRRIFTHCLIIPADVLTRFANNPFAVARVMTQHDLWQQPGAAHARLEAFSIPGGTAPVDQALLHQLAIDPGPRPMAALVQAARDAVCLAVGGPQPIAWIAGLFSCLPTECRLEFSFTTGLKFSPQRPFRIVALSDDPAEQAWVASYPNVMVLDPTSSAIKSMPSDGWTQLIERALDTNQVDFLAAQISKRRFDLSLDDLPALGLQLLEHFDWTERHEEDNIEGPSRSPTSATHAHAAHRQFQKSARTGTALQSHANAAEPGLHATRILEKLERLDDLVYEAISGQADSLEELRTVWPQILNELGDGLLVESREQYLRYALSIWEECADGDDIRNPARAIQALDVLSLLFGDGM